MKAKTTILFLLASIPAYCGGTYTVYNFANTLGSIDVKEYRNGVYWGTPVAWQNIPLGESRDNTSTAGDGVAITVREANSVYLGEPLAGYVTPRNGVFVIFGTNQCVTVNKILAITNTTMAKKMYVVKRDGEFSESGGLYGMDTPVPLGNVYSRTIALTVCSNGTVSPTWEIYLKDYYATVIGDTIVQTNSEKKIVSGEGGNSITNMANGNPGGNITNTLVNWYSQTNSLVNFSGTSSTAARDDTLKAGFNVIAQKLDTIAVNQSLNSGSGSSGGTDNSDVVDVIGNFRDANTNLLGDINEILGRTNLSFGTGSGTNSDTAAGIAGGIIGGIQDSADAVIGDLGSAPSILGGGASSIFTFSLAGNTINLDPEVRFPGASGFFKAGIMMLAGMALARYLVDLYLQTATVYATSQTGGVPAIGPWGTVGLAVVIVVATAIVTAWVGVFALLFSYGLDNLIGVNGYAASFSTSNAGALYLINLFLPVGFLMSCAWTRIIAPFVVTKAIIATASLQRFLIGK